MELREPYMLLLILPLILTAILVFRRSGPAVRFSSLDLLAHLRKRGLRARLQKLPQAMLLSSVGCLIVVLAGPRHGIELKRRTTQGVDIVLCIDVSGSMVFQDMDPDRSRLDLVKQVVENFVDSRKDDQIGLVVFARRAYRLVPMTPDHDLLKEFLNDVHIGMVDRTRTAVGDALAKAVDVAGTGKARSKVVILLSDGASNAGSIPPDTAADMARALDIKCYTVGAGTDARVIRVGFQAVAVDPIDEALLASIAEKTGGRYFRAKDEKGLQEAYAEIDRLEKTVIEGYAYRRYSEYHPYAAGLALVLLFAYLLTGLLWIRRPV
ncbi:MAG: VWA domain-containing protein [Planctomycetes bacterium]|nr:VWA domain-containing protein [Planctomycetota bacterium]